MTQNLVSILNAPTGASQIVTTAGVISVAGSVITPYKSNLVASCRVQRSSAEKLQVWSVVLVAGVANTLSFAIQQVVNGIPSLRTFQYEQTAADTAATVEAALDGFFGADATAASGVYVTASWGAVKFQYSHSSNTITLLISQVTGQAFPIVSQVDNTTVTNGMVMTLASQVNVDAAAINFKVTAGHGLATGDLVAVGTLTGQTAANNTIARVVVTSSTNFTLQNALTLAAYTATGTGTAVGTVAAVATLPFGTADFVTNDALANGSTETATVTANNYSLVTIEAGYIAGTMPNITMPVAPIHLWVSEDSYGLALIASIVSSYLK